MSFLKPLDDELGIEFAWPNVRIRSQIIKVSVI